MESNHIQSFNLRALFSTPKAWVVLLVIAILVALFPIGYGAIADTSNGITFRLSSEDSATGLIKDEAGATAENVIIDVNQGTSYSIDNTGCLSITNSSGVAKKYSPDPASGYVYSKWLDSNMQPVAQQGTINEYTTFYLIFKKAPKTLTIQSATPTMGKIKDDSGVAQESFNVSVYSGTTYRIDNGILKLIDADLKNRTFEPVSETGHMFSKWVDNNFQPLPSSGGTITESITFNAIFILPTVVEPPTSKTGLVYNGNVQTGVEEGTGFTLTGNSSSEAGSHIAVATLSEGYVWSDWTSQAKNIPWYIDKANSAITNYPENIELKALNSETYTFDFDGDGAINIVSGDTEIITVEYSSGKSFLVKALKKGNTTLTISASNGYNYYAPEPVTIPVKILGQDRKVSLVAEGKTGSTGHFFNATGDEINFIVVKDETTFSVVYDLDGNATISFSDGNTVFAKAEPNSKLISLNYEGLTPIESDNNKFNAWFDLTPVDFILEGNDGIDTFNWASYNNDELIKSGQDNPFRDKLALGQSIIIGPNGSMTIVYKYLNSNVDTKTIINPQLKNGFSFESLFINGIEVHEGDEILVEEDFDLNVSAVAQFIDVPGPQINNVSTGDFDLTNLIFVLFAIYIGSSIIVIKKAYF